MENSHIMSLPSSLIRTKNCSDLTWTVHSC